MTHKKADEERRAEERAEAPAEGDAAALAQELEAVKAAAAENLDGWKRTQAELANYRKRVERDAAETRLQAVARAAGGWFAVLDDLLRALKERPTADNYAAWADGMDLIYRKGMQVLELEGIVPIQAAAGEAFDPGRHEAVTMEPCTGRKEGEIIETVRCGYALGERVLRPAQVRVACEPPSAD